MKNDLHIINGDAAAGVVNLAKKPEKGNLLVNYDPISLGPMIDFDNLDHWSGKREQFIRSIYPDNPELQLGQNQNDIITNLDKIKAADHLYLWLGSGVADQLFLVWIIRLFTVISADIQQIRRIQFFQTQDQKFEVVSLGLLSPEELLEHPTPEAFTSSELAYLEKVWRSVSGSNPLGFISLIEDNPGPLPLLARGLGLLVGRFPDHKTGLTFWDHELLNAVLKHGPAAPRIVGRTISHHADHPDRPGDHYLFHRLRNMGAPRLRQPLVELTGRSQQLRHTEIVLTENGMKVVKGRINNVALNGLNERICGILLRSDNGSIWYRKNSALIKG